MILMLIKTSKYAATVGSVVCAGNPLIIIVGDGSATNAGFFVLENEF
jgi:hypothetical protein